MNDKKQTNALPACPFCGKTKVKCVTKNEPLSHYNGQIYVIKYRAYMTCNCCHARGPIASDDVPDTNNYHNQNKIPAFTHDDAEKIINAIKNNAVKLWSIPNKKEKTYEK